jgi:pimeloyl-ACP methyl ester carboxylesterase
VVGHSHRSPRGLWVQEVGDGPVVVLVHGAMDRSGGMLRVRRALQDEFRVVRYDRRGYGRSLAAGAPSSVDQQVEDLAAVVDGRVTVLAGHSFGGVLGLALAERAPELVRAVLAYEAPMMWEPWWPRDSVGQQASQVDPSDAAEWFLRRMIGDRAWDRLPASMRAERRAEGPTLVAEMRSVRPGSTPPYDPERIGVPVVAAHGGQTKAHHRRAVEELAARVPDSELVVVDGAGHGAHLTHPAAFAELVRRAAARAQGLPAAP